MSKLIFNSSDELKKLAKETLKKDVFKIAYEQKTTDEKSVFLVKDDGIYLMNAFKCNGSPKENGLVAYAQGYNPKYNKNCWEDSYKISRDDFGTNIPLNEEQLKRIANGGKVSVKLKNKYIEVTA